MSAFETASFRYIPLTEKSKLSEDYFSKIKRVRVLDGDGSHKNTTTNFEGEIT